MREVQFKPACFYASHQMLKAALQSLQGQINTFVNDGDRTVSQVQHVVTFDNLHNEWCVTAIVVWTYLAHYPSR